MKQFKMNQKKQTGGFLSILLGTLGTSLLGYMLAGKGTTGAGYGSENLLFEKRKGINGSKLDG